MKTKTSNSIEPLESRIAPSSATFTYVDVDGDPVNVIVSSPSFITPQDIQNAATLRETAPGSGRFQLETLDLTDSKFSNAKVKIQSDLIAAVGQGGNLIVNVGYINATGRDLKEVFVRGDLGRIDAGDGDATDRGIGELKVDSLGKFGVTTQGAGGNLSSTIKDGVRDFGVSGDVAATVNVLGKIRTLKVTGNIVGGDGANTGVITATEIKTAEIRGSVTGGKGVSSGRIGAPVMGEVHIGKNVVGGEGNSSGTISTSSVSKAITIEGDLQGGAGPNSGAISTGGQVGKVKIGGNVRGGAGNGSAVISSAGSFGGIIIDGSLIGNGANSGVIFSDGALGVCRVGCSIVGGDGDTSGRMFFNSTVNRVKVNCDILGGDGLNAGSITALGRTNVVTVGGSLVGGAGNSSGLLFFNDGLGVGTINGNLIGGDAGDGETVVRTGAIQASEIDLLTIGGSVISGRAYGTGSLTQSGVVQVKHGIGTLVIAGDLRGNPTNRVVITGEDGPGNDMVFNKVTIGGSVSYTDFFAGYSSNGVYFNADAEIGKFEVLGGWSASNLVAGAAAGADGMFGTADDVNIGATNNDPTKFSSIARVIIRGVADGLSNVIAPSETFGIVASQIESAKIGLRKLSFTAAPGDDVIRIGNSGGDMGDFFAHEVATS